MPRIAVVAIVIALTGLALVTVLGLVSAGRQDRLRSERDQHASDLDRMRIDLTRTTDQLATTRQQLAQVESALATYRTTCEGLRRDLTAASERADTQARRAERAEADLKILRETTVPPAKEPK